MIWIILGIVVNGLAGYALAKINFPFRERWLLVIMMLMIVPTETIITINFLFIAKMGLLNTVIGYILPMIVNPFNISIIVTIKEMASAIVIIAGVPAPTQIIMMGPRATLGKLLSTTR